MSLDLPAIQTQWVTGACESPVSTARRPAKFECKNETHVHLSKQATLSLRTLFFWMSVLPNWKGGVGLGVAESHVRFGVSPWAGIEPRYWGLETIEP